MIKHIHLDVCDSTQDVLKEQLINQDHILVSCENQTSGRGRGENKWTALPGSLCLSLNLSAHSVISFTALEVSVIVAKFFETKGQKLQLKWPNDLWDKSGKKCGGILVQGSQANFYVGIGLNLFSMDNEFGSIFETDFAIDKKSWAKELADFIHSNRYTDTQKLKEDWHSRCGHLNQLVSITEGNDRFEGIFQGLGSYGEAELNQNGKIQPLFNGSLRVSTH